jgi:hypothetical protein
MSLLWGLALLHCGGVGFGFAFGIVAFRCGNDLNFGNRFGPGLSPSTSSIDLAIASGSPLSLSDVSGGGLLELALSLSDPASFALEGS